MESTVLGLDFSEIGYLLLPSSLEIVQTIGHLRKAPRTGALRRRPIVWTISRLASKSLIQPTNQPI